MVCHDGARNSAVHHKTVKPQFSECVKVQRMLPKSDKYQYIPHSLTEKKKKSQIWVKKGLNTTTIFHLHDLFQIRNTAIIWIIVFYPKPSTAFWFFHRSESHGAFPCACERHCQKKLSKSCLSSQGVPSRFAAVRDFFCFCSSRQLTSCSELKVNHRPAKHNKKLNNEVAALQEKQLLLWNVVACTRADVVANLLFPDAYRMSLALLFWLL